MPKTRTPTFKGCENPSGELKLWEGLHKSGAEIIDQFRRDGSIYVVTKRTRYGKATDKKQPRISGEPQ